MGAGATTGVAVVSSAGPSSGRFTASGRSSSCAGAFFAVVRLAAGVFAAGVFAAVFFAAGALAAVVFFAAGAFLAAVRLAAFFAGAAFTTGSLPAAASTAATRSSTAACRSSLSATGPLSGVPRSSVVIVSPSSSLLGVVRPGASRAAGQVALVSRDRELSGIINQCGRLRAS
jgi:hypothetical protein